MPDPSGRRRPVKSWDSLHHPKLIPVTGFRDQSTRTTYIPWSDVMLGLLGFEIIPDLGRPVIVYFVPKLDAGVFEIRCHATTEEPHPETDHLLGTLEVPADMFDRPDSGAESD